MRPLAILLAYSVAGAVLLVALRALMAAAGVVLA